MKRAHHAMMIMVTPHHLNYCCTYSTTLLQVYVEQKALLEDDVQSIWKKAWEIQRAAAHSEPYVSLSWVAYLLDCVVMTPASCSG